MKILKSVPIHCVELIEECLPFYEKNLGFKKKVEVPHEGKIGFVILESGESSLMLQSHASLRADLPEVARLVGPGQSMLYCDVDSIQSAIQATKGLKILAELRSTFYGAKEIFVLAPSGVVMGFAEH